MWHQREGGSHRPLGFCTSPVPSSSLFCASCVLDTVNSSGNALFFLCGVRDTMQFDNVRGVFASPVLLLFSRLQ